MQGCLKTPLANCAPNILQVLCTLSSLELQTALLTYIWKTRWDSDFQVFVVQRMQAFASNNSEEKLLSQNICVQIFVTVNIIAVLFHKPFDFLLC